jgi:copper(I)-binding protein
MSRFLLRRLAIAALVFFSAAAPAAAESPISVENAWSRATPGGAEVAAGYLTIVNQGDTPDRLMSASTSVASKTEIHEMKMTDGKMEMRPVPDGISIPAKGTVTLEPAGYHLMLLGLKAPLEKGSTFTGSLTFEHAGTVEVTFSVAGMGASAPDASGHH